MKKLEFNYNKGSLKVAIVFWSVIILLTLIWIPFQENVMTPPINFLLIPILLLDGFLFYIISVAWKNMNKKTPAIILTEEVIHINEGRRRTLFWSEVTEISVVVRKIKRTEYESLLIKSANSREELNFSSLDKSMNDFLNFYHDLIGSGR
jgi:hypothetical protein